MAATLAEVLRAFGPAYLRVHSLSTPQARAWRAIVACRTPALGGELQRCDRCGREQRLFHSCRNRHCPQCQSQARDVLEAITGEFGPESGDDAWAVRREDGSWLMDGLIPVPEIKDRLEIKDLPEEDRGRYNTLAGMIMLLLGRLPRTTDAVEWGDWRFEVVDLDGKRVDKVLVSRNTSPGEQP